MRIKTKMPPHLLIPLPRRGEESGGKGRNRTDKGITLYWMYPCFMVMIIGDMDDKAKNRRKE
jgi:hypothetical protein